MVRIFWRMQEGLRADYRSNPSITHESDSRRSRMTRVTAVVRLAPTLGVSAWVTRQLTRAVVPSIDSTRTASIATLSSRMSLKALARLSTGMDGWTFLTASASRLSSAAAYR